MAAFSTIGIILLVCAMILFAYQGMAAFLGMGASDDFLYENINLSFHLMFNNNHRIYV